MEVQLVEAEGPILSQSLPGEVAGSTSPVSLLKVTTFVGGAMEKTTKWKEDSRGLQRKLKARGKPLPII